MKRLLIALSILACFLVAAATVFSAGGMTTTIVGTVYTASSPPVESEPTAVWMAGESIQTTNNSGEAIEAIWQAGESVIVYK